MSMDTTPANMDQWIEGACTEALGRWEETGEHYGVFFTRDGQGVEVVPEAFGWARATETEGMELYWTTKEGAKTLRQRARQLCNQMCHLWVEVMVRHGEWPVEAAALQAQIERLELAMSYYTPSLPCEYWLRFW
jgi:hypothetical protein